MMRNVRLRSASAWRWRTLSIACIAAVALLGAAAPPASAQGFFERVVGFFTGSGDTELGVEAETPNVEAQGPAAITAGTGDTLLIVDTLNRRIVRVRRDGTLVDRKSVV